MDNVLKGKLGFKGERGFSAYEIAVQNGFVGTEKDWLAQLGTSSKFDRQSVIYEATEGQKEFDIPEGYTSNSFLDVYVDGEHLDSTEYTLNTETMKFTLTNAITVVGTKVEVMVVTMSTNELPIVEGLTESSTNETVLGAKSLFNLLSINVKNFGAKGDGVTDDTQAIQNAIYYAFENKKSVFIPGGNYLISKPLVVISDSNELLGSFYIKGENVENTKLTYKNVNSITSIDGLNGKYGFILLNETYLDENKNIKQGTGNTGRIVISDMFLHCADGSATTGIYCPISTFSCSFERMRIREFTDYGIMSNANYYLNRHEQIRVDSSKNSFYVGKGICTSLLYDSCYSVGATEIAYKIKSIYSEISNCCADVCTGTVFDLSGFRGAVISPGSESPRALCTFKGSQYTNATIIGAYTYGNFDDEEAYHIIAEAGSYMKFLGGYLLVDDLVGGRKAPGGLLKSDTLTNVSLDDVRYSEYTKEDPYRDLTVYKEFKTNHGRIMTRHGQDIAYVGFDGGAGNINEKAGYIDGKSDNPKTLANAIFFGFGTTYGMLSDEKDVRWHQPNIQGDILLSKKPKEIGGIGWIQASETIGEQWSRGEYLKIPVILSGTSEERPTEGLVVGQMYFDTTLNKPIWHKGGYVWVDATGTTV